MVLEKLKDFQNLKKIGLNVFHILFVSILLIILAFNLTEKKFLFWFTLVIAILMACYHGYRAYKKLES